MKFYETGTEDAWALSSLPIALLLAVLRLRRIRFRRRRRELQ